MKSAIIYSKELEGYSFGEGHPFGGDRFAAFFDFFEKRFTPFRNQIDVLSATPADDELLCLVHTKEYIDTIRRASKGEIISGLFQYVSMDNLDHFTNYIPRGIDDASRIIVGSSVMAGDLVMEGKYEKAIAFGGAHHAKPSYGEGFCFHNDVAILARHLKKKYKLNRILILDTDAHAGNGTKEIFYDDPEVLFIDIHQDPSTIYPGVGFIDEIGKGRGEGFTVNIPVEPKSGNNAYNYIFEEVIFPLASEFKPQMIIRNGGSDPHYRDLLTSLGLTIEGFRMIGANVRKTADKLTGGRCVDLILSGYNKDILPYAWSAIVDGLLDLKINLSDFKEDTAPPPDAKLAQTKDLVAEIKRTFKKYWKCLN